MAQTPVFPPLFERQNMSVAELKSDPKLHAGRVRPYDHRVSKYWIEIPYGLDHKDVENPGFWVHVVKNFRPGDEVLCFAEDSSWERLYRVLWVGKTEMKLSPLGVVVVHRSSEESAALPSEGYEIAWKGPAMQFAVVDKKSGEIVKDHLYPKELAVKFLSEYTSRLK